MHKYAKVVVALVVSLFATSFVAGCAHMEKSPPERNTWLYIHKPLPEASRKVDEARAAGKDRECPAEFNAAKDTVDKAYDTYNACHTQEGIALAQDGINKLNALCPPKVAAAVPPPAPPKPKVMVFEEVALFDVNKAELKPEGKEKIKAYREEAQAELSRADKIKITGHTDNTGGADYNMKLSLKRAESVRDYLTTLGVDPGKMEVYGEGETKPIADNATKEGRAKNRRVEIEVYGLEK